MNAITTGPRDVLLVIDVQNDFCPGGALAVPRGHEVVPVINNLVNRFEHVVLTQDWHPRRHSSFASSHPGKQPFSQITLPYGPQTLWPDHCIQGSSGARFHDSLSWTTAQMVIRKGFRPAIDSYSAFFENDKTTPTGLTGYLRERGLTRVFCCGLAFDFCVRYSAEDAHAQRFETLVIEDACRAIDMDGSAQATRDSLGAQGIALINSSEIR
jgi:nicotinamidase/pyrazinamidase